MIVEEHFCLRETRLEVAEPWRYQREGMVVLIFKTGAGKYVVGDLTLLASPGDVLILSEGAKGTLSAVRNNELAFFNFSLCLEHLFPLFASSEIALLEDVMGGLKNAKLLPAASMLAAQVNRLIKDVSPEFNLDHRSQLLRVAAAILTEEFKTAHQRRSGFVRTEDRIVQVFENLSTDELLNLSIDELAAKFGCSRRHLSRLSQQCLGRSIAALKMEMRLMKAATCLRNPLAKIINVAEQCGFNHLGLFNTCFKKRFGASPGKWRNLAAEKSSSLAGGEPAVPHSAEPGSARLLLRLAPENNPPVPGPVPAVNGHAAPALHFNGKLNGAHGKNGANGTHGKNGANGTRVLHRSSARGRSAKHGQSAHRHKRFPLPANERKTR